MLPDEDINHLAAFPDANSEIVGQTARLTADLRKAARMLTRTEARFFVDAYYMMQKDRIRAANQATQLAKAEEPNDLMLWLASQRSGLEKQVGLALNQYSQSSVPGLWLRSIPGIGPVIAAGLMAHIDIEKAPTAGHIWSFAGLLPDVKWEKGKKRPWNADLKRLCYLMGESFVKVSNRPNDIYGKIYKTRKEYEAAKNANGDYADQAKVSLETKNYGDETEAKAHYLAGRLPPARIHLRAKRYAVRIFLSHYQQVAYENFYGKPAPKPWVIEHGGHVHVVQPPHWVDGKLNVE